MRRRICARRSHQPILLAAFNLGLLNESLHCGEQTLPNLYKFP
jgi:hypothetical protein